MPNIGALLKQEIARLSRREARAQMQATKKASVQYRHAIAGLKREIETMKRQLAALERRAGNKLVAPPNDSDTRKVRFVAKGLRSQRTRLGLSADAYGKLIGVSAQSIYNWERGHATPRPKQVGAIAALRGLGKKEVQARLEQAKTKKNGGARRR